MSVARAASPVAAGVAIHLAAGSRLGFGHLVRMTRLCRAMGLPNAAVHIRGAAATHAVARSFGLRPATTTWRDTVTQPHIAMAVIDDPSAVHGGRALHAARRAGCLTVTIHDLGLGVRGADIVVDGSARPDPDVVGAIASLQGLQFAMIDPACRAAGESRAARLKKSSSSSPSMRRARSVTNRLTGPRRVLIALGGGPRLRIAARLAAAITTQCPRAQVDIAIGFVAQQPVSPGARVRFVTGRDGLADLLARADVAVTAGGVTMLEAAAVGVPLVGVAVVAAQRPTVRALVDAGVAWDAGDARHARISSIADVVVRLLDEDRVRLSMHHAGRRLVDGGGVDRVAARLRQVLSGRAASKRSRAQRRGPV